MIKTLKIAAIALAMACGTATTYAVPAYPGKMTHTNPDGTTTTFRLHGDEWHHYTTTDDGCLITRCADGFYHYATVVDGKVEALEFIASDATARPAAVTALNQTLMKEELVANRTAKTVDFTISNNGPQRSIANGLEERDSTFPTTGKLRFPVILVDFPDRQFKADNQLFEDWLSKEGYNYDSGLGASSGSITDYYKATSNGQFEPQFDVFGPITTQNGYATYGTTADENMYVVADMIGDICEQASKDGLVDFSNYDNDNDGVVDVVYIIYAGAGYADSDDEDSIWPHKWSIYAGSRLADYYNGKVLTLNGKIINGYGCSPELSYGQYFATIGTFCHEFGHAIGLLDHYDVNYTEGIRNVDNWDIMSAGSYNNNGNTPPLMSAYERNCLGWLKPVTLTQAGEYTLKTNSNNANYNDAYFIPTSKDNEYFILENRQLTGWDAALPHHGMLVWHIDYDHDLWVSNEVNTEKDHQRIDIIEAGGVDNTDETFTPYPGAGKNSALTFTSTPAMKTWDGTDIDAPITNIAESSDGVITFTFKGGDNSGIGDIIADGNNAISIDGLQATVTAEAGINVDVYTTSGVVVASQQMTTSTATVQLPSAGVYIVKVGGKAYKISAK